MRVGDVVTISPGFQRSINVVYDLDHEHKVMGYLPTERTEIVIKHVLDAISGRSNDGATMLVGTYGAGKSHLITIIGSLYTKALSKETFQPVLDKLQSNEGRLTFADELNEKKRMLVVPISCSADDPAKTILLAVKRRIREIGLEVEVHSDFKIAQRTIAEWCKEYPLTYVRLKELLNDSGSSLDDLELRLDRCDKSALDKFKNLYPVLTSGAVFDGYLGDVAEVMDSLGRALPTGEYRGILLILDEFNKMLDSAARGGSNLKLIQDLAELASRQDKGYVLHLLATSHRAFSQYTSHFSKLTLDQWQAVEGRFRLLDISNRPWEIYSLISRVLVKGSKCMGEIIAQNEGLRELKAQPRLHSVFEGLQPQDINDVIIEGCFPLHPLTTYCLPRISSRVAQNERTLFTFLAGKDDSPLSSALSRLVTEQPLVLPWQIWDYFAYQLERSQDPAIKKVWQLITGSLEALPADAELGRAIIKTLGVLMLANNGHSLPLTMGVTKLALSPHFSADDFEIAVKHLENRKLLFVRRSDETLCLVEPAGVDVEILINEWLQRNSLGNPLDQVVELTKGHYVIPNQYNLTARMTRYLTPFYCDTENIRRVVSSETLSPDLSGCDGVICYLFPRTMQEKNDLAELIRSCSEARIIFVLPCEPRPIADAIARLFALINLQRELSSEDARVEPLLDLYVEDARAALTNRLSFVTSPSTNVEYYRLGQRLRSVYSDKDLSVAASTMMQAVYSQCPVFNNELINKHAPTLTSRKARNTVIKLLLEKEKGLRNKMPSSQEEFMFDSLLVKPQLYEETSENIKIHPSSSAFAVLNCIYTELTLVTDRPIRFDSLMDKIIAPPFGVRKGVIPILLAVALIDKLESYITILDRTGSDCQVSADLFERMVSTPSDYTLVVGHWSEPIERLAMACAQAFDSEIAADRIFANRFMDVAEVIFRWLTNLPRFARETHRVSDKAKALRTIARGVTKHPKKTITIELPRLLGFPVVDESSIASIISALISAKEELDNKLISLTQEVSDVFSASFSQLGVDPSNPLSMARSLTDSTSLQLASHPRLAQMVTYTSQYQGYDDTRFVQGLASVLTGIRLEDWLDVTMNSLMTALHEIQQAFAEVGSGDPTGPRVELLYLDKHDRSVKTVLAEQDISSMGTLLQSDLESVIEDFRDSIPKPEKRQILLNILKKMM